MKHKGLILTALGVAVVIILRNRQAAAAPAAMNLHGSIPGSLPGVSGAPVPDLSTSLALQQESTLSKILSALHLTTTTSSSSSSTSTATSKTTSSSDSGATLPSQSVNWTSDQWRQWASENHQAASGIRNGANALGVGAANGNASGGFNSGGFKVLQSLDFS